MRLLCWAPLFIECSANWLLPGRLGWRNGRPTWLAEPTPADRRLKELQDDLSNLGLDGYLIPHNDHHGSEYTAEADKRLEFISGFTGSAGTALVLQKGKSFLYTDGRYWEQARKEVSDSWIVVEETATASNIALKVKSSDSGGTIGIDPHLFTHDQVERLSHTLQDQGSKLLIVHGKASSDEDNNLVFPLVPVQKNLIDGVKIREGLELRSNSTRADPFDHASRAGQSVSEKIRIVQRKIRDHGATHLFVANLSDLSWLFNLRSRAIPYSRAAIGFCLVNATEKNKSSYSAILWLQNLSALSRDLRDSFAGSGVELREYDEVRFLAASILPQDRILIDKSTNYAIARVIEEHAHLESKPATILTELRASKNDVEVEGMRLAQLKDGLAVSAWLAWFKTRSASVVENMTERQIIESITKFRATERSFIDNSFPVIAGAGGNGAIIHYSPEVQPTGADKIGDKSILLVDSGAHYDMGTTDITRTLLLKPQSSKREKLLYTRVLMGHLALSAAVFHGDLTTGAQLDMLARLPLWKIGLNYAHSTGHGVGHSLTVHESIPSIGSHATIHGALQPNMIVSNEPGVYLPGEFGIRIENLLLVKSLNLGDAPFYAFDELTVVPYERDLIDVEILSESEIDQINSYHKYVRAQLQRELADYIIPEEYAGEFSLQDFERWLLLATEPL